MLGYTDNYIRVTAAYDASLTNTTASSRLDRINGDGHMEALLIGGPVDVLSSAHQHIA